MTAIRYTDPARVVEIRADRVARPGTASGYGRKLPTRYRIRYVGEDGRPRWHRVYAMCYGNAASAYILARGAVVHLDTDTEHRAGEIGATS